MRSSDAQHGRAQYMVSRIASLLLADVRNTRFNGESATVAAVDMKSDSSMPVPFVPLLLSLNAFRNWPDYERLVVGPLQQLVNVPKRSHTRSRYIDWGVTFNNLARGGDAAIHNSLPRENQAPTDLLARILLEYQQHIAVLVKTLRSVRLRHPGATRLITKLSTIDGVLLQCLTIVTPFLRFDAAAFSAQCSAAIERLLAAPYTFDSAFVELGPLMSEPHSHPPVLLSALTCRRRYWSLDVALGRGRDFLVHATTDEDLLYELWCFFELAVVLTKVNRLGFVQTVPLSGERNLRLFTLAGMGTATHNHKSTSSILRRTCVEWFIRLKDGRTILLDTKYQQWNSKANLTVMGYMMDFNAQVGIVAFAGDLPESGYRGSATSLIATGEFAPGKLFVAVSLIPDANCEDRNQQALSALIDVLKLKPTA